MEVCSSFSWNSGVELKIRYKVGWLGGRRGRVAGIVSSGVVVPIVRVLTLFLRSQTGAGSQD